VRIATLLTLTVLVPGSLSAIELARPSAAYSLEFWRETNGLPQSTVRSIVQTKDGYLWLGTRGGVVRFDGVRFTTYSVATGHLQDDEVIAMVEDRAGVLWIGTYAGLTAHHNGRFTNYGTRDGLPSTWVRALDVDSEGQLWIGTPKGVCRYAQGRFTTFSTTHGLSHTIIRALCAGRWPGVYVAAGPRLYHFDGQRFVEEQAITEERDGRIRTLNRGTDGSLLVGFENGFVKRMTGKGLATYSPEEGLGAMINGVYEDSDGTLWVSAMDGVRYLRAGKFIRLRGGSGSTLGPAWCVSPDRERNLWIGTLSEGLVRLRQNAVQTATTEDGLPNDVVQSVYEDRRGTIWVGATNGLASFGGARFEQHRRRDGLPLTMPFSINEDQTGGLLVAQARRLFTLRGGVLEPYPGWKGVESDVRVVCRAADGSLWLGTDGDGLHHLGGGRVAVFHTQDGLASNSIRAITADRQGALWIGTFGGGASRYKDGRFTSYREQDGLASDIVHAIHEDDDGALYFATRAGLSRYQKGVFTTYREGDGLPANYLFSILDDERGHLWFTCAKGIFYLAKSELRAFAEKRQSSLRPVVLGVRDGMLTGSCVSGHQPTAARSRNGQLLFSTMKGLVIVDPARLPVDVAPPPVQIEDVVVDGRPLDRESPAAAPGTGDVSIAYTAFHFVAPEGIRFRYKLEGFDRSWVEAGTRRAAYYTNLPPRSYRFLVAAASEQGAWSSSPARIDFRLKPAFHQTYWFLGLTALAGLACLTLVVQLRIRRLKTRERELTRRVNEAVASIKTLQGLLPICAACKRIRDDQGYWTHLETYISAHTEADFTHGICPDCQRRLYPEYCDQ
jgi:ligand-binding sensor domain-containing protein